MVREQEMREDCPIEFEGEALLEGVGERVEGLGVCFVLRRFLFEDGFKA